MKHILSTLYLICLLTATTAQATVTSSGSSSTQKLPAMNINNITYQQSCFESNANCEKRVIQEISQASKFILYQTDSFNSRPIAEAIVTASKQKNMITELIFAFNKFKQFFKAAWLVQKPKIIRYVNAHTPPRFNKTIIIDGNTLILNDKGKYTFIKNNPVEINKHIKEVLQYRQRSQEIK